MSSLVIVLSIVLSSYVLAAPHNTEYRPRALPAAWYHPESHPVRALFKRDVPTPGSQQWTAQYPKAVLPPIPEALTPQPWLTALQTAEQAGQIPNITIPTQGPTYGQGDNPSGPQICSSTWQCRGPGDQWDAPDGHVGIGFDDGPSDGSALLYQYLDEQNLTATHFMIGVNILQSYQLFDQAYSNLQNDIAVHTWTHPYMTTMNNTQVVAQLGWTMQIIHDSTGGRVPRYWRPPYGDSDNRVRAIAKQVFGLTQIDWNHDSADWNMNDGRTTLPKVEASINSWYSGPKSPGLIILEHELTNKTSTAFMDTFPALISNNWTPVSVVQLFDGGWQNSDGVGDEGDVQSMDVGSTSVVGGVSSAPPSATSSGGGVTPSQGSSNNKNDNNTNGAGPCAVRVSRLWIFGLVSAVLASVLR